MHVFFEYWHHIVSADLLELTVTPKYAYIVFINLPTNNIHCVYVIFSNPVMRLTLVLNIFWGVVFTRTQ